LVASVGSPPVEQLVRSPNASECLQPHGTSPPYIERRGAKRVCSGVGVSGSRLDDFQVYGCYLAVTARLRLKGNLLVFIKLAQPGLFDVADMHEHIVASTLWLDEAETFLRIEPLHCSTLGHGDVLLVEMLNEHGYRDIAGLSRNCSAVLTWQ